MYKLNYGKYSRKHSKNTVSLSEINEAPNENTHNNYIENYFNVFSDNSKDKDSSKKESNSGKNSSGEKEKNQTQKKHSSENENSNKVNNNGNSQNASLSFDPNSISSIRAEFENEIDALETKFENRFEAIEKSIDNRFKGIEESIKEIKDHLFNLNPDKKTQNDANNKDNK